MKGRTMAIRQLNVNRGVVFVKSTWVRPLALMKAAVLAAISSMLDHATWSIERGAPVLGESTPCGDAYEFLRRPCAIPSFSSNARGSK